MKKKTIWLWILPILWMGVIFYLSHQQAQDSSELSGRFLSVITNTLNNIGFDIDEGALHTFVRKTAHFSLYFVLGILTYIAAWFNIGSRGKTIIVTASISIGYAITDEFHQYFIPGRSCELRDVLIDSGGVLTAILICLAVQLYLRKRTGAKEVIL